MQSLIKSPISSQFTVYWAEDALCDLPVVNIVTWNMTGMKNIFKRYFQGIQMQDTYVHENVPSILWFDFRFYMTRVYSNLAICLRVCLRVKKKTLIVLQILHGIKWAEIIAVRMKGGHVGCNLLTLYTRNTKKPS